MVRSNVSVFTLGYSSKKKTKKKRKFKQRLDSLSFSLGCQWDTLKKRFDSPNSGAKCRVGRG